MIQVQLLDLVEGVGRAVDAISTLLAEHHRRTSVTALRMAEMLHLSPLRRRKVRHAALLHDVGVVPLRHNVDALMFEKDMQRHSVAGWTLLRHCPVLCNVADMVLYHHTPWEEHKKLSEDKQKEARYGALISLADAMDTQSRSTADFEKLYATLRASPKGIFVPEDIEALGEVMFAPDFWEEFYFGRPIPKFPVEPYVLNTKELIDFSKFFSYIIDSRSPFTATHTMVVAQQCRRLCALAGASEDKINDLYVAGLLHDIGKLGVPVGLLEKNGRLTNEEFAIVKRHAAISRDILTPIRGLEKIGLWAASHHERLDGKGYPSGLTAEDLPFESRVVAVADVLTAITEDRPYRLGMPPLMALSVLDDMVEHGALDGDLVSLVHQFVGKIDASREMAQEKSQAMLRAGRGAMEQDILDGMGFGLEYLNLEMP